MENKNGIMMIVFGSLIGVAATFLLSKKSIQNDISNIIEEKAENAVKNEIEKYGEDRICRVIDQKISNDTVNKIQNDCANKLEARIFADVRKRANTSLDQSVKEVVEKIERESIEQEVKYKLASSKKFIDDTIQNVTKEQAYDILRATVNDYVKQNMDSALYKLVGEHLGHLSYKDLDTIIRDVVYERSNDIFNERVRDYLDHQLRNYIRNTIEERFQMFQSNPFSYDYFMKGRA